MTSVPAHMAPEISSSSSGRPALAEMPRARKPIDMESARATTPRTMGSRNSRCRLVHETSGNDWISISPRVSGSGAGLRTATAQVETPRIMTPSMTAWPPTGASRCAIRVSLLTRRGSAARRCSWRGLGAPGALGGATLEALDPAAGVDELLLARVERVAVRADLDVHVALGGTRFEHVPARAAD